jgi:hypothetical protein
MLARLVSLLLVVLTRDGTLHRFDGSHDATQPAPRATAIAVLDARPGERRIAVLAGARLTVDGRAVPGRFDDVTALAAGGATLWGRTRGALVQIDARSGRRANVLELADIHLVAADGAAAFAEAHGVIVEVGTDRRWKVAGRPIALAAGAGKLWIATKEGPLWEIDRQSGAQRDLALGDWWGTVALAHGGGGQLYAVTVAGKLWHIDPASRQKTIVAMDGWQGAIDLAVLR